TAPPPYPSESPGAGDAIQSFPAPDPLSVGTPSTKDDNVRPSPGGGCLTSGTGAHLGSASEFTHGDSARAIPFRHPPAFLRRGPCRSGSGGDGAGGRGVLRRAVRLAARPE